MVRFDEGADMLVLIRHREVVALAMPPDDDQAPHAFVTAGRGTLCAPGGGESAWDERFALSVPLRGGLPPPDLVLDVIGAADSTVAAADAPCRAYASDAAHARARSLPREFSRS